MCIFTDASLPRPNVFEGITDTPMPAIVSRAHDIEVAAAPSQMVVLPYLPPVAV